MRLVDLSRPLFEGMPRMPSLPPVEVRSLLSMADGAIANVQQILVNTHCGTHVDAPLHMLADGACMDEIPLDRFCGPACGVALPCEGPRPIDADELASATAGLLQAGDILIVSTGWDRLYGEEAYFTHPYFTAAAARWMVAQRLKMVCVDAFGVDMPLAMRPPGHGTPVHRTLLAAGVLIAENLAGTAAVAGGRFRVYAFPVHVRRGDGGFSRIVAEVEA